MCGRGGLVEGGVLVGVRIGRCRKRKRRLRMVKGHVLGAGRAFEARWEDYVAIVQTERGHPGAPGHLQLLWCGPKAVIAISGLLLLLLLEFGSSH